MRLEKQNPIFFTSSRVNRRIIQDMTKAYENKDIVELVNMISKPPDKNRLFNKNNGDFIPKTFFNKAINYTVDLLNTDKPDKIDVQRAFNIFEQSQNDVFIKQVTSPSLEKAFNSYFHPSILRKIKRVFKKISCLISKM